MVSQSHGTSDTFIKKFSVLSEGGKLGSGPLNLLLGCIHPSSDVDSQRKQLPGRLAYQFEHNLESIHVEAQKTIRRPRDDPEPELSKDTKCRFSFCKVDNWLKRAASASLSDKDKDVSMNRRTSF